MQFELQRRKFLVASVRCRAYKCFSELAVLLSSQTGAISMGCRLLQLVHDILFLSLLTSFSCQPLQPTLLCVVVFRSYAPFILQTFQIRQDGVMGIAAVVTLGVL